MRTAPFRAAIPLAAAMGWIAAAACAQTNPAAIPERSTASWENLRQLRPGQKIHVVQKDGKSWSGSFATFADDSVAMKVSGSDRTIPRGDIRLVSRHGGKHLRNALIGAAAGGGAGAAIGAAVGGCSHGGWGGFCVGRGAVAGVFGGLGAVIGGGIGAAIPGNTVVYRAPAK